MTKRPSVSGPSSSTTRTLLWTVGTIVVFALLFFLVVALTSTKNSTRENNLYQFIFLAVGVAASFLTGRQSARAAAADVVRPTAKAAVRRLASLAAGMQGFGVALNAQREYMEEEAAENSGVLPLNLVIQAQTMLEMQIAAQIRTATDAMEDWREFVPDEVAAIERGGESSGE